MADDSHANHDEPIRALRTTEHIRQNPGMYIGSLGVAGLHQLLFGLVKSAITAANPCQGRSIRVTLHRDGSVEVVDDATGLPPKGDGILSLDNAFVLQTPPSAGSRNWVDYAAAAALSEWLHAESRFDGGSYRVRYGPGGQQVDRPTLVGPANGTGLTMHFLPDRAMFAEEVFHPTVVRERLRRYAFLDPGLTLILVDEAAATEDEFVFEAGLRSLVEWLDADRRPLHSEILVVHGGESGIRFDAALRWCEEDEENIHLFANGERVLGGTQLAGLRAAVTRSLNVYLRNHLSAHQDLTASQARAGLTAALAIWGDELRYEGSSRSYPTGSEPRRAVERGLGRFLRSQFQSNPAMAEQIARAAMARQNGPAMTEEDWLEHENPGRMLRFLSFAAEWRQLVLLLAACVRHTCDLGQSTDRNSLARSLVSYADARLTHDPLRQITWTHRGFGRLIKAVSGRTLGVKVVAQLVRGLLSGNESSPATQADLVREIFGNPFRSVCVEASWLTPTVLNLARQAYEDEEMGLTPILADALQDAGCEDETLLHHLRDNRLHVPGCWALDLFRDPRSSLASREIKASGEVGS